MNFIILNILYLVLPFLVAWIHCKTNKPCKTSYFNLSFAYFVFINIFLKGVPIGFAAITLGQEMALENGWAFSPMYAQYGVAIGTMGIMGLFATFISGGFRVAVSMTFALFLIFAAVSHITQAAMGVQFVSHNVVVLIISDLATAILLFYFLLNKQARGK
jgi:uncharacterized membrane protein YjjP (DUF1212 family)